MGKTHKSLGEGPEVEVCGELVDPELRDGRAESFGVLLCRDYLHLEDLVLA